MTNGIMVIKIKRNFLTFGGLFLILIIITPSPSHAITPYDGEYLTHETTFEFEFTQLEDPNGYVQTSFGANHTGSKAILILPETIFGDSKDVAMSNLNIEVTVDGIEYKSPQYIFKSWVFWFFTYFVLPIEISNANLFDSLEDSDPVTWDKDGNEVTWENSGKEIVYDYNTGVLITLTNIDSSYSYVITYNPPAEKQGLLDKVKSLPFVDLFPISALAFGTIIIFKKRKLNF